MFQDKVNIYMRLFTRAKYDAEWNYKGHHKFNQLKTSGNGMVKNITETDISGSEKHHGSKYPNAEMLEDGDKVPVEFV